MCLGSSTEHSLVFLHDIRCNTFVYCIWFHCFVASWPAKWTWPFLTAFTINVYILIFSIQSVLCPFYGLLNCPLRWYTTVNSENFTNATEMLVTSPGWGSFALSQHFSCHGKASNWCLSSLPGSQSQERCSEHLCWLSYLLQ